jgi:hypothetical protein
MAMAMNLLLCSDELFFINCVTCQPGASSFAEVVASQCNIISVATGGCVEVDSGSSGVDVSVKACNGKDNQLFDFASSTA